MGGYFYCGLCDKGRGLFLHLSLIPCALWRGSERIPASRDLRQAGHRRLIALRDYIAKSQPAERCQRDGTNFEGRRVCGRSTPDGKTRMCFLGAKRCTTARHWPSRAWLPEPHRVSAAIAPVPAWCDGSRSIRSGSPGRRRVRKSMSGRVALHECLSCGHLMPTPAGQAKVERNVAMAIRRLDQLR